MPASLQSGERNRRKVAAGVVRRSSAWVNWEENRAVPCIRTSVGPRETAGLGWDRVVQLSRCRSRHARIAALASRRSLPQRSWQDSARGGQFWHGQKVEVVETAAGVRTGSPYRRTCRHYTGIGPIDRWRRGDRAACILSVRFGRISAH